MFISYQKIHAGSGDWNKKKRSVEESIQKVHAGSGAGYKMKRSTVGVEKISAFSSGDGMKKRRSIVEPVQVPQVGSNGNDLGKMLEKSTMGERHRGLLFDLMGALWVSYGSFGFVLDRIEGHLRVPRNLCFGGVGGF